MNHKPTSQPAASLPVIHEPKEDSFQMFKKDPRLNASVYQQTNKKTSSTLKKDLEKHFNQYKEEEVFFDALREFKTNQINEIIHSLETAPILNRPLILNRLSDIADNILYIAYNRIRNNLKEKYGLPHYLSSYKQNQESHLAIVGMGKLGGQEINYHSDLDVIFIYSHRGETMGNQQIDNNEYFVKLTQKYINTLSVMTSAGRCYQIDTELRPSGNAGALVISYDHFLDHQMNKAQPWERQALIRARAMSANEDFQITLQEQIEKLAFNRPLSAHFTRYMHQIRQRVIRERAKKSSEKEGFDIKLGEGSLMDIEFILHHLQLKHSRIFPELKQRSLFILLNNLQKHSCLDDKDLKVLTEAHLYYRTIESLLHLEKKRSESFLEFKSDTFDKINEKLNMPSKKALKEWIEETRNEIKRIYKKMYQLTTEG